MQQMLTAVWLSQNEDEFYEILKQWLYVRDKTLDPYVSLIYAKYLREHPDKGMVRKEMIDFELAKLRDYHKRYEPDEAEPNMESWERFLPPCCA